MGKCLSCLGNGLSAGILLLSDALTTCISSVALALVAGIDCLTGSGHNTARKKVAWHEQRFSNEPVYKEPLGTTGFVGELDVKATLARSTFPLAPEKLIELTRQVLRSEFGTAEGHDGSCLAEDFQFVAPIVGPLGKGEFTRAFGSFKVRDGLPDITENNVFMVDPLEPNRVWFLSRMTATHTGTLNFGRPIPPTGKKIQYPPQASSMLFNEQGQCYTLTVGYTMDKRIGNTEGLGGVFGILKVVGAAIPVPEGNRLYNPSKRWEAFERIGRMVEDAGYDPNTGKKLGA